MTTNDETNQNSTGIQSLTSSGTYNGRTITGTANQVSISNGDGTGGNPTVALTSTIYVSGISFDSGSNSLTSYSSGTFTPTLTGVSSNPSVTYTTQVGFYQKLGNFVFTNGKIVINTISGGTGNTSISSMPFTSINDSNESAGTVIFQTLTWDSATIYYDHLITGNDTRLQFQETKNNTTKGALTVTSWGAADDVEFNCNYYV